MRKRDPGYEWYPRGFLIGDPPAIDEAPQHAKFVDDEGNFVDTAPKDGVYLFTGGVGRFLYEPIDVAYPGEPFAGMKGLVRCSRCGYRASVSSIQADETCLFPSSDGKSYCGGTYRET